MNVLDSRPPPAPHAPQTPQASRQVDASTEGLTAIGVGKTYKGRQVVRNVSVTLQRGEAVGLLGPNGAGKTSTLSAIESLLKPTGGSIRVAGFDNRQQPLHARAAMMFCSTFRPRKTLASCGK